MCAKFDLEVASWLLSSRLDLDSLCRLMLVYIAEGRRPNGKVLWCDAFCVEC
jgi:hypothetical protein